MKLLNHQDIFEQKKLRVGKLTVRSLRTIAIAVLVFVGLTACTTPTEQRVEKVGGVTARQVIENPAAYVGKTVTVSGEVEEIWNPRAFNMDSGLTVGELLVVGREAFPNVPDRGNTGYLVSDIATVTGVVRMFVTAEIEREIGWDLDPQIEAEFNAKPVLIAQSIGFKPGTGRTATPRSNTVANQTAGDTNVSTAQQTGDRITDIGSFASTTDKLSLVGREAQLMDVRVNRVVGPRTFTIGSGNSEIYVMLDEASARAVGTQGKIDVGDSLDITGVFQGLKTEEFKDIASGRFRALTEQEREFLKKTPIYLEARQVGGVS